MNTYWRLKKAVLLLSSTFLFTLPSMSHATHPAGGNCGHTHTGPIHNLCDDGVDGDSCTVDSNSGTCRQTSSSCLCKTAKAVQQEQLITSIDLLMLNLLQAKLAKAALGKAVLAAEVNSLFWSLFHASSALQGTGKLAYVDSYMGFYIDRIAANLAKAQSVVKANSTVSNNDIKAEFIALTALIQALKIDWTNQQNETIPEL